MMSPLYPWLMNKPIASDPRVSKRQILGSYHMFPSRPRPSSFSFNLNEAITYRSLHLLFGSHVASVPRVLEKQSRV
jgi:hypothetical protein